MSKRCPIKRQIKNVFILGPGLSGLAAQRLLKAHRIDCTLVGRGEQAEIQEETKEALEALEKAELFVLSPGISRDHPLVRKALEKGLPIWSEIELAYHFAPDVPLIAVTGSNGKTTTVTLLSELLRAQGKRVWLGGNIGVPFADLVLQKERPDFIVLELSSFQLESIEDFRPKITLLLNLSFTHGERYTSMEDYARAKFNISKHMQEEDLVLSCGGPEVARWWGSISCQKIKIEQRALDIVANELPFETALFSQKGRHNLWNLEFCLAALQKLNLWDREKIQHVLDTFEGVDFRLQKISSWYSPYVFNDAKSTNWQATLTALEGLQDLRQKGRPLTLILGGQKRGGNDMISPYKDKLEKLADRFLCFGETAKIHKQEWPALEAFANLAEIADFLRTQKRQEILLFSPAFPSFDQYANYVARGKHFNQLFKGPE